MNMNKLFSKLSVVISLFSFLLISGVSAMWVYAGLPLDPVLENNNVTIMDFYYPENVPDDEENETSHNALLQKIISFDEGINNPNSLLSNALEDRIDDSKDDVSSNQQVQGGNLRNIFSNVDGFEYIGFLIYFYSETEYYIFTFDNRHTTSIGDVIEVYLTKAIYKENQWVLSGGYQGTAITIKYDGKTNGPYKNTIDYSTWGRIDT